MRKLAIAVGIVIVVLIAAVAIFAATFDINRYRGTIQTELAKHLGRNVTLGEMNLNFLPPRFVVHNVTIADDPKLNTGKAFVQAQALDVSPKLLPLLHKSVEIDSLYLERPYVELIKDQQGHWNFSSLGTGQPSAGSQQQGQLSLSQLKIQDGQVAVTDRQAKKPRTVYDHIDVTLRDFAPGKPFSLDAAVRLPGAGNQQMSLQGSGGPIRQDEPAATPFHGTLTLQQVAIAAARQFVSSPMLAEMDGSISGHTTIASDSGKLTADGNLTIQNARMKHQDLGFPIALQYKVDDDVAADLLQIQSATLKFGTTPIQLNGSVNSKPTPSQIDVHIRANGISIAEAARLAALSGTALTPGATVTGSVDANIEARGAADKPALNGTVTGHNLQVSGKDFPQPLQVQAVDLALTPAEVRSNNFTVSSGTTSANVQFAVRQYTSNNPTIDATVKAPNAQFPAVLSMAKAYGVQALDKVSGAGTLNLDLHAAGPVRSTDAADLIRALNGAFVLNLHDVRYAAADMSHELSSIAGLLGWHESNQGATTINKLTGNVDVKNGVAQTSNLEALLDIGNVGIAGTADLATEQLNLKVNAVMSKDLAQKVGGTNVGGYAKTALANSNGELVIPAKVTGTFQHPSFAPDLQQVAQMKLKGLIPSFNNPTAAISGILGNVLKQQQGGNANGENGAQPQQPSQPQNPLQSLQDLFGRKKQQK